MWLVGVVRRSEERGRDARDLLGALRGAWFFDVRVLIGISGFREAMDVILGGSYASDRCTVAWYRRGSAN